MVNDVIGDSINRIKMNYFLRNKSVKLIRSRKFLTILRVLYLERIISSIDVVGFSFFISLDYGMSSPFSFYFWRISKPGRRVYFRYRELRGLALKNVHVLFSSNLGYFLNSRLGFLPILVGGEVVFGIK